MLRVLSLLFLLVPLAKGDSYSDAQSAATKAFLLQSGIQSNIDKAGVYFEHKAKYYADTIGATPYILTGGIFYKIYRTRAVQIPYRNTTWTLGFSDSFSLQWRWSY